MRHEEDKIPKALARPGWEVSLPRAPESRASARPSLPQGSLRPRTSAAPHPAGEFPPVPGSTPPSGPREDADAQRGTCIGLGVGGQHPVQGAGLGRAAGSPGKGAWGARLQEPGKPAGCVSGSSGPTSSSVQGDAMGRASCGAKASGGRARAPHGLDFTERTSRMHPPCYWKCGSCPPKKPRNQL